MPNCVNVVTPVIMESVAARFKSSDDPFPPMSIVVNILMPPCFRMEPNQMT